MPKWKKNVQYFALEIRGEKIQNIETQTTPPKKKHNYKVVFNVYKNIFFLIYIKFETSQLPYFSCKTNQ